MLLSLFLSTVHNTWFKKWKLCASGILSSAIKDGDVLYSNVVLIIDYCKSKNLDLLPTALHLDFEKVMHNVIIKLFPSTNIRCCTFHLEQCWWRKIQSIGLSKEYKEKNDHVGKWLTRFCLTTFSSSK